MSANAPNKLKPIGLKRNQFGVIAFVVLFAAWLTFIAVVPPLHVMKVNIGDSAPLVGQNPLLVEILYNSEVIVNGEGVTLSKLTEMAMQMRAQSRTIILKPNACAPYDTVIKSIAAIKRAGVNFTFSLPDYSTRFERALPKVGYYNSEKWSSSNAIYSNVPERFQMRTIRTVFFDDECQRKNKPSSELNLSKSTISS